LIVTDEATIAIDCGKLWWESAIELFPKKGLRHLDAVIITHEHADAMGGLDNLRDFTNNIAERDKSQPLTIYLNQKTFDTVKGAFPYLVPSLKEEILAKNAGGGVPDLRFVVFENHEPFEVHGIRVTPFHVHHGGCNFSAFRIGELAWVSDCSSIPTSAQKYLQNAKVVVLDFLRDERHPSHFGWDQVVAEARGQLADAQVWLVGMCHSVEHEGTNRLLRESGLANVACAWDGKEVPIDL
jgi:phosphoribosyl 1,2-cyclic phosphodiesterase